MDDDRPFVSRAGWRGAAREALHGALGVVQVGLSGLQNTLALATQVTVATLDHLKADMREQWNAEQRAAAATAAGHPPVNARAAGGTH